MTLGPSAAPGAGHVPGPGRRARTPTNYENAH